MRRLWIVATVIIVIVGTVRVLPRASEAQQATGPVYQVDPFWPQIPEQWTLGQVAGVAVDSRDHVWIIQRPWSLSSSKGVTSRGNGKREGSEDDRSPDG